eukprot:s3779_g5.t1
MQMPGVHQAVRGCPGSPVVHPGLLDALLQLQGPDEASVWDTVVNFIAPLEHLRATLQEWAQHGDACPEAADLAASVILLLDPELCCDSFRSKGLVARGLDFFPELVAPADLAFPFVLSGPVFRLALDRPPLPEFRHPFHCSVPLAQASRQAAWHEAACDTLGALVQQAQVLLMREQLWQHYPLQHFTLTHPTEAPMVTPNGGWLAESATDLGERWDFFMAVRIHSTRIDPSDASFLEIMGFQPQSIQEAAAISSPINVFEAVQRKTTEVLPLSPLSAVFKIRGLDWGEEPPHDAGLPSEPQSGQNQGSDDPRRPPSVATTAPPVSSTARSCLNLGPVPIEGMISSPPLSPRAQWFRSHHNQLQSVADAALLGSATASATTTATLRFASGTAVTAALRLARGTDPRGSRWLPQPPAYTSGPRPGTTEVSEEEEEDLEDEGQADEGHDAPPESWEEREEELCWAAVKDAGPLAGFSLREGRPGSLFFLRQPGPPSVQVSEMSVQEANGALELAFNGLADYYRCLALEMSASELAANPKAAPKEKEGCLAFVAAEGRLDKEDRHPASSGYGVQKDMTVGVKKCQDVDGCMTHSKEALEKFKACKHPTGVADTLRMMVLAMRIQADVLRSAEEDKTKDIKAALSKAESLAKEEAAKFKEAGDKRGEAVMLLAAGEINYNKRGSKKRFRVNIRDLNKSKELAKQAGDKKVEATAVFVQANAAIKLRMNDDLRLRCHSFFQGDSYMFAQESYRLYEEAADKKGMGKALHIMALAQVLAEDFDDGVKTAEQALAIFREMSLRKLEAFELFIIAHYYLTRKMGREAIPYAEDQGFHF